MIKKKLVTLLSLILAMSMLASCASTNSNKKTKETDETKETKEVVETTKESEETLPSSSVIAEEPVEELKFEDIEFLEELNTETLYEYDIQFNREEMSLFGKMKATVRNSSGYDWDKFVISDWSVGKANNIYQVNSVFEGTKITIGDQTTPVDLIRSADFASLSCDLPSTVADGEVLVFETIFSLKVLNVQDRFGWTIADSSEQIRILNALPLVALFKDGQWVTHPYTYIGESFNNEAASFDVKFKCPAEYTVAMTGTPSYEDGKYHSVVHDVRDFAIILATNCSTLSVDHNGILITAFAPDAKKDRLEALVNLAESTIDYFSMIVGPYPYDSIDLFVCDVGVGSGMEYPLLVTGGVGNDMEEIFVHEIAHEWFYLTVGNDEFEYPWIDESFSQYLTYLYFENVLLTPGEGMLLPSDIDFSDELYDGYSVATRADDDNYVISAYLVGPTFLNAIREAMGDDSFFAALNDIYLNYKFLQATTDDIMFIFNRHSETDLSSIVSTYFKPIVREEENIEGTEETEPPVVEETILDEVTPETDSVTVEEEVTEN